PRVRRPSPASLRGEPAGDQEAGRDQAGEADGARYEVRHAVPGDLGRAVRRTGREAQRRVRTEHPGRDQAHPVRADQRGAHVPPRPGRSARRSPTASATVISPVATKLVIWIQPGPPLLSRLHGWRVRSNPARVSAWASDTRTYTGPAITPYASRVLVMLCSQFPPCSVATGSAVIVCSLIVLIPPGTGPISPSTCASNERRQNRHAGPTFSTGWRRYGIMKSCCGRSRTCSGWSCTASGWPSPTSPPA